MKITATQKRDADKASYSRPNYIWTLNYDTTWNEVLHQVGPSLLDEASEKEIADILQRFGIELVRDQPDVWPAEILEWSERQVSPKTVDDVLVQLFALDLVARGIKRRTNADRNRYWVLTRAGQDQLMRLRAIRRPTLEEAMADRRAELALLTVPQLRAKAVEEFNLAGKGRKAELIDALLLAEGFEGAQA
jgi:hypothetical protein